MNCPYGGVIDDFNPMKMVWFDDSRSYFNLRIPRGLRLPLQIDGTAHLANPSEADGITEALNGMIALKE